jgi:hypothetical protein
MCGPLTVPFTIGIVVAEGRGQKTAYGCLALICATYSSFAVWRAERIARNAAEDALVPSLKKTRLTSLAEFSERARELRERVPRSGIDNSDEQVQGWRDRFAVWTQETGDWLAAFSPAAAARFRDTSGIKAAQYMGVSAEIQREFGLLERYIRNLTTIADNADTYLSE